jgi:hypothetical protein
MSNHRPTPRASLGFGGAVGIGAALALLVIVIAVGHAVLGQVEGAMRVVITFAEIAVCTVLGALALAALGVLAYGAQRARLDLAERRAELAPPPTAMRAEVLADGAEMALSQALTSRNAHLPRSASETLAIQGKQPETVLGDNVVRLPSGIRRGGDGA